MNKNLIWPIFLSVISISVVAFTSLLSIDLYRYYQLKCAVPVEHMEASISQLAVNRYCVELNYLYQVNTSKYSRNQKLNKTIYKNAWLANKEAKNLEESPVYVWYNPHKPQLGVVNKAFPYKRLFSTSVLYAVFLYFCFLGRFILKRI
ncbi:MAG: hypothetical protein S4CHLAM6_11360 [Chlamydiae bacterium]|nr:hypothetical protein [Chlamydiota bacterium]